MPARRLTLAVDPERGVADIRVAVLINGRRVLDDAAFCSGDQTSWTRTVQLPYLGEEAWLNVEINSTDAPSGDPRPRGVRLRALTLER